MKIKLALVPSLLMAALAIACSASPSAETNDSEVLAKATTTNTIAPRQVKEEEPAPCDFKCECEKKGGTVSTERDNWCCKGLSCTSAPEDIVVWVTGDPLPPAEKYPHTVLWMSK